MLELADTARESAIETIRFKHEVSPIATMHVIYLLETLAQPQIAARDGGY